MTQSEQPRPDDLGERAGRLWDEITNHDDFTLRVDEYYVLESACREMDIIDRMEAHQRHDDLIGVGSQGQPVAAPLLAELRQHRALFNACMKQLALPNADGRHAARNSATQRANAQARWKRSGSPISVVRPS
jgi:hypothetical protein